MQWSDHPHHIGVTGRFDQPSTALILLPTNGEFIRRPGGDRLNTAHLLGGRHYRFSCTPTGDCGAPIIGVYEITARELEQENFPPTAGLTCPAMPEFQPATMRPPRRSAIRSPSGRPGAPGLGQPTQYASSTG